MTNSIFSILDSLFGGRDPTADADRVIVVGLGNPGDKYARTRHNLGFWFIDKLAEEHGIEMKKRTRHVVTGEGVVGGRPVVLAKPRTYVNNSGEAVKSLITRYKASSEAILVVYDELNLPLGKTRLRRDGSAGGHNGIKSIISAVGSQDFPRLRIGIGRPTQSGDEIDYVLGRMSPEERKTADEAIGRAVEIVGVFLTDGITEAMSRYN